MKKFFIIGFAVLYATLTFADITPLPDPPQRTDPANFATKADAFLGALPDFATEANALATTVNGYKTDAEAAQAAAEAAQAVAQTSANFKGNWSDQTGAAAVPYSVYHEGNYWQLVSNLADVTASEPGVTAAWKVIGGVILADGLDQLQSFSVVDGAVVYLKGRTATGDGGQGVFVGKSGDFTSEVTADTLSGVYAPSDADSDGSEGCWVRQYTVLRPQFFGATADGVTDDYESIQAAVIFSILNQTTIPLYGADGRPCSTIEKVVFPKGKYRLSQKVICGQFTNLYSEEGAYFELDAGIVGFEFPDCYLNKVQGLSFNGGLTHLYFENANVDATRIEIDNCDFQNATSYAIDTRGTGGTTQISGNLMINDNCRFVNNNKVLYNSFDECRMGGWVEVDTVLGSDCQMTADSAMIKNAFGILRLYRMIGIPNVGTDGTRKANLRWIDNVGGGVYAENCRFGGESSGIPIVYNYTPQVVADPWIGCTISIKDCDLFCGLAAQTDNGVVVIPTGGGTIPQIIDITGCKGPASGNYINNISGINQLTTITGLIAAYPSLYFRFTLEVNNASPAANYATTVGYATDLDPYITSKRATEWYAPSLLNSWANVGSPFLNAAYRRDENGTIHLRGFLNIGVPGTIIFILPEGFRPYGTINSMVLSNDTGPVAVIGWLQVNSSGEVTLVSGGTSATSLCGVSFQVF